MTRAHSISFVLVPLFVLASTVNAQEHFVVFDVPPKSSASMNWTPPISYGGENEKESIYGRGNDWGAA